MYVHTVGLVFIVQISHIRIFFGSCCGSKRLSALIRVFEDHIRVVEYSSGPCSSSSFLPAWSTYKGEASDTLTAHVLHMSLIFALDEPKSIERDEFHYGRRSRRDAVHKAIDDSRRLRL